MQLKKYLVGLFSVTVLAGFNGCGEEDKAKGTLPDWVVEPIAGGIYCQSKTSGLNLLGNNEEVREILLVLTKEERETLLRSEVKIVTDPCLSIMKELSSGKITLRVSKDGKTLFIPDKIAPEIPAFALKKAIKDATAPQP